MLSGAARAVRAISWPAIEDQNRDPVIWMALLLDLGNKASTSETKGQEVLDNISKLELRSVSPIPVSCPRPLPFAA